MKTKLAAGAATAAAAAGGAALAAKGSGDAEGSDDDATYALEWRNRYLAARVKYLEGRVAEAPAGKPKAVKAKTVKAKKAKPLPSLKRKLRLSQK